MYESYIERAHPSSRDSFMNLGKLGLYHITGSVNQSNNCVLRIWYVFFIPHKPSAVLQLLKKLVEKYRKFDTKQLEGVLCRNSKVNAPEPGRKKPE